MRKSTTSEAGKSGTITRLLRDTEARLTKAGIDNAPLDARVLLAHILQLDRVQLISQADRVLTKNETQQFEALIARRAQREPVSRILGAREFWGLSFTLNEATLVPRPDSETLIEAALKEVKRSAPLRILDLGAGSGCLLLALLHELPNASGVGIDAAPRAVEQATHNAKHLGLTGRATFRTGNWLEGIDEHFDLIISNPPYIAQVEISLLMPEVRNFDPMLALDGGGDGLAAYRLLIPQLRSFLKPYGVAVFEIGEGQALSVCALFSVAGFRKVFSRQDLTGIERCIVGTQPTGK